MFIFGCSSLNALFVELLHKPFMALSVVSKTKNKKEIMSVRETCFLTINPLNLKSSLCTSNIFF